MSTNFPIANPSVSDAKQIQLYQMNLVDNYGLRVRNVNEARLLSSNTGDRTECVSLRHEKLPVVNTHLDNLYPAPTKAGVQYSVRTDNMLSTQSEDGTNRVDEPIVVSVQVRHPLSPNITEDIVVQAIARTLSAMMKEDGTWRIGELMTGCTEPRKN